MRAMGAWARAAVVGLGVGLGCSADAFLCESDEGCQQGGLQGLCQASGYCSFPDETCPSGQRYGEHAGGSLANTCVEPEALGESGGTTDAGVSTSTTSSGPTTLTTTTTTATTATDDDGLTTMPVDPDTGPSESTSSGGMADDEPGTTTSTSELVCDVDEFDDGMLEPTWCPTAEAGTAVDEVRGLMRVHILPQSWPMGGSGGWVETCDSIPLAGTEARLELFSAPQVSPFTESFFQMGDEQLALGMGVIGGELYPYVWVGMEYTPFPGQPYEPNAHRWLRLREAGGELVAEHSPDGAAWVFVHSVAAETLGADGYARFGVWSEMLPLGPDEATYERFELCTWQG